MVKARKRLSKSAWILLALLLVGLVTVVVLASIGYISLAFAADGLIGLAEWMSLSPFNVGIVLGASFVTGMGVFWWLKAYLIGEEQVMMGYTNTNTNTGGYNPLPSTPSASNQRDEVEIS